MSKAYLGLGSNLGDRRAYLADALRRLGEGGLARVSQVSSIYESAAVGMVDQPDFLNLVAEVRTELGPRELLGHVLAVENALGRVREQRWGPRTIDIDILWFDGVTIAEEMLVVPHPRLAERAFVLAPLAEIAATLRIGEHSVAELAALVDGSSVKRVTAFPGKGIPS